VVCPSSDRSTTPQALNCNRRGSVARAYRRAVGEGHLGGFRGVVRATKTPCFQEGHGYITNDRALATPMRVKGVAASIIARRLTASRT
jgi:hypothetical protein